jgi:hypothetical protein
MTADGRSRVLRRALTLGGLVRVRWARLVRVFSWLARSFGRLDRVGAVSRLGGDLMIFVILSLHYSLHSFVRGTQTGRGRLALMGKQSVIDGPRAMTGQRLVNLAAAAVPEEIVEPARARLDAAGLQRVRDALDGMDRDGPDLDLFR